MTILLALIGHIFFGLIGVFASLAVVLALVGKRYAHKLALYSSVTAFASYMLSWLLGGWYYITFYGSVVKPVIKGGEYPWAHIIVMESKEHIFLMLPILAAVLALIIYLRRAKGSKAVATLAILTAIIAVFILVTGVLISGAVQR